MSPSPLDARTDAALRALDPATTSLTIAERERADETFARVLTTPVPRPGHERRSGRRRSVLVAAGVLAAVTITVPVLLGGESAFASWSAVPAPLSHDDDAVSTCRSRMYAGASSDRVRVVMAERRGGWTFVTIAGPAGEAECLAPDASLVARGVATQGVTMGGFTPDPSRPTSVPRDGLVASSEGGGSVPTPRRLPFLTRDDWYGVTTGYAGEDVTAVTVHPPVGPDVQASLVDGRYSAWWPAGEARGSNPGVSGSPSFTMTLRDGTTRRVEPLTW